MKNRVVAAALLMGVASFFCVVRPVAAAPALWVVESGSSKVYLFGTVHVLRDDTPWHSPELEAAINESQNLYLEIADIDNKAAAAATILKLGVDRGHPLSTIISKADVALLDKEAKQYGFPGEVGFEPMRPWLVYLMLSALPAIHSGYGSSNGVDLRIRQTFASAGKPVRGFETVDMQARIFADMPQSTQVALLEAQLKHMSAQSGVTALDDVVGLWSSGDQEKLAAQLKLDDWPRGPLYDALIRNRNKAWANTLAQRLKEPGTSFVAVGAAHMLGADGVPALLQEMGFKVTRVHIAQASASTSPTPTPAISPTPAPTPAAALVPATLTPPTGWVSQKMVLNMGGFSADSSWAKARAVIVLGHMDALAGMPKDLATFDLFFHQGLVAVAGPGSVQPSKAVKICGGKQNGLYTKANITSGTVKVKEDILLALSDRAYLAEYVRAADAKDDPAAIQSLSSLCTP